jgi:hypothetical protein
VVGVLARAALAAALAVAALLKARRPGEAIAGLTRLGVPVGAPARVALASAIGVEAALALAVAAGLALAAYAAAALMVGLGVVLAVALARGRGGEPCPCFGSSGAIEPHALVRNALLAGGFAALPSLPWAALALTAAATVAASVRRDEAGPPAAALEIVDEGPELGSRVDVIERFARPRSLALAVFTSPGCAVCAALRPALERLAAHAEVEVIELDERRDAPVWAALAIPGSPYAVALSADGVVGAKGTFNTARQLESVLATAERRLRGPATTRRAFLAGAARLAAALAVGAAVAGRSAEEAEAYHFCGHTFTTGSCPHPTGLPRTDARGYPLRASDGKPVDDLGRPVDAHGRPVDRSGRLLRDPQGQPLPPAPRTPICRAAGEQYRISTRVDGSWYRCCGGHVRRLSDCCSYSRTRINGDGALPGYCRGGRRVFCVQYFDTNVKC